LKRLVVGKIYRNDDTPWLNARGYIQLLNNSYTNLIQYPENRIEYITDTLGNIKNSLVTDLFLWCNEEGNIESKFRFFLPSGKYFDFTVPVGTSPIELSVLRENLNSSQPGYQSIVNYIDTAIEGLQLVSTQIYSDTFIAATNLSALRIVNLATRTYASNQTLSDASGAFGLTTSAVNQGVATKVLTYGAISDNRFNFTPGYLFLSDNGNITQTINNSQPFILNIGVAIYSNKIKLDFQEVTICI
jgi:hypothetical protein